MSYEIKLDIFEGPLDLLLYLIKKNEIDIYNIPIALITDRYLQYLEIIQNLNLDFAGEYLVLASTLIHIKSQLLLPRDEQSEEPEMEDPRQDLVHKLLEYQYYKEAALCLDNRSLLERDVFKGTLHIQEISELEEDDCDYELNIFDLVKAFQKILAAMDEQELIEIYSEKISLSDRINEIMDKLAQVSPLTFTDLIMGQTNKKKIIYTFLAILELMKSRIIRAYQGGPFSMIRIFLAVAERENFYAVSVDTDTTELR